MPRVVEFVPAPVLASAGEVGVDAKEHSYATLPLAAPPSPALEVSIGDEDEENASMQVNISSVVCEVSQPKKKAKLSAESKLAEDSVASSPDLHHKLPARMRSGQDENSDGDDDDGQERSNLYGVNFLMWFSVYFASILML